MRHCVLLNSIGSSPGHSSIAGLSGRPPPGVASLGGAGRPGLQQPAQQHVKDPRSPMSPAITSSSCSCQNSRKNRRCLQPRVRGSAGCGGAGGGAGGEPGARRVGRDGWEPGERAAPAEEKGWGEQHRRGAAASARHPAIEPAAAPVLSGRLWARVCGRCYNNGQAQLGRACESRSLSGERVEPFTWKVTPKGRLSIPRRIHGIVK